MDNIIGKKFGRLTVLDFLHKRKSGHGTLLCICDCGKQTKTVTTYRIISGHTQSCGCMQKEAISKMASTHKMSNTSVYNSWLSMRERCNNKNTICWSNYGGRGISICKEWNESFEKFMEDFGHTFKEGLQIDRINNDGNYELGNVRWVTPKQNSRNRSSNLKITIDGVTKLAIEWAEEYGISDKLLRQRYNRDKIRDKVALLGKRCHGFNKKPFLNT